jgi:cell wall-associated NlpC family hydrolase
VHDGRKRISVVAATLVALLAATVAWSIADTPVASAKPDIATVKKQVAHWNRAAEIASERFNNAQVKLAESRARARALDADLTREQKVVDGLRSEVAAMVVGQYQNNILSTTSQVVLSNNPDAFLDKLNAVTSYNDQRGQVMSDYTTELSRLQLRKAAVDQEAAQLASIEKNLRADKRTMDARAAKAQALLAKLQGGTRTTARVFGSFYAGPIPKVAANGLAGAAVRFALAQVGKPYMYGGTGLGAYDCSGLTMRAWGAAGVSLAHSAAAQYGEGTYIPESQLQPGDLVFYYSPISHVGMYIGNGLIVNAENPEMGVRIAPLHSMPYVGAVRPG